MFFDTGNAAKADRLRKGVKAKDMKYIMPVVPTAPSSTLSIKPSSPPCLPQPQHQQQKLKPVSSGVEKENAPQSPSIEPTSEDEYKAHQDENENKDINKDKMYYAPNTGGFSPLESHAEEDLQDFSQMSSVQLQDQEISNRAYIESPKNAMPLGSKFCDLV